MKKAVILVLALALLLNCGAAMADKLGLSCMDCDNPFFGALEGAIREVVEANGDELVSLNPKNDNEAQLAQIDELIGEGIAAIFVDPVNIYGIKPGLEKLKAARIPIYGFDSELPDDKYLVTYVDSNNYNAGYACGADLVEKCPGGGEIIVLDSPTMQSVVDRTDGFMAAIRGHGFEVVSQVDCMGEQEQGKAAAAEALAEYPVAVAIFAGNDLTALGAVEAAAAAESACLIYSVDGSPDIKALIAEGKVTATAAQSPITIGKTIAELYYKVKAGEAVESRYSIDTFIINGDNVAEYNDGSWQ